jgi:SulP family sulfate permease
MIKLRKTGYHSRSLAADIALGVSDGIDNALWCYAFVTVIFTGALSVFLPVGILTMFFGWALLGIFVTLTSKAPLHMANTDEKAVVIIASISVVMVAEMGAEASSSRGLATLLAIISISSLTVSAGCYFVGRYRLARLLELLPYPVVCGFMAGIGWLLLDAGVVVAADASLAPGLTEQLTENGQWPRLILTLASGAGLMWVVNKFDKSWALPVASATIIAVFYLIAAFTGTSKSELTAAGWLIEFAHQESSAFELLGQLSFSDIDKPFIFRMIPEIMTLVFLVMLGISMSLSALKAASKIDLSTTEEFKIFSGGNLICGLIACPPGYTDVVASTLFEKFGASSRWMPLISSSVCLLVILAGGWIIGFLPMVLVGATIFLFAFQTLYEWLHDNVKSFSLLDYAIVWVIFGTVIFAGFTQGIIVGIILTVLLFVFRYSMISAIQARHTLRDHRSSVERSVHDNAILDKRGTTAVVFTLRGFLFFGTANSILDTIKGDPVVKEGKCRAILLDMKWVTGIDISALNTFVAIRNICETAGIELAYSGISSKLQNRISIVNPENLGQHEPLLFKETDFAVEFLENLLLESEEQQSTELSIRDYLADIVDNEEKVDILLSAMNRIECKKDDTLFKQGDLDTGLFIVERGTLSAHINVSGNRTLRVKKFAAGSLIGELSAYMADRKRTAAVVADEDSVIYQLSSEYLEKLDTLDFKLAACIHELVATTLAERVSYMNRRLMVQLD